MDYREMLLIFIVFTVTACNGASMESRRVRRDTRCFLNDLEVGCFSNDYPFNNSDGALPLSSDYLQTRYLLLTRSNPVHTEELVRHDAGSLSNSQFRSSRQTVFIVHGFEQNGAVFWTREMATQLLRKGDLNVIVADWGWGSGWPYTQAVANTRLVGAQIAAMIWFLNNVTGTTNQDYHLVGHSLGAHVCGYAGERLQGLRRITGLDPAEPNFKNTARVVRLDTSDADFVDVIHTDGSDFDTISGYGMLTPVGHVDFYPNGGMYQPGCPQESWTNVVENINTGVQHMGNELACSHSRSIQLFISSIMSECQFTSYPCSSYQEFLQGNCFSCGNRNCPVIGYDADRFRATGSHYLSTTKDVPYCGYPYQVNLEFGRIMTALNGRINIQLVGVNGVSDFFSVDTSKQAFMPNQIRNLMFVAPVDIGDVLHVHINYQHTGSWFHHYFYGSQISVRSISIERGRTETRWTFCGREEPLSDGGSYSFPDAVNSLTDCPIQQINVVHL